MDKLHAKIGQQHLEIEDRKFQYAKLLELLAGVLGGQIAHSRVMVNLTDQTWELVPEGQSPAAPGTINGLPQIVVGSDQEEAA